MFLWFSLLPVFLNPCYTCFLLCSIPWYLCLCVHVYVFDIFETGSPYVNPDSSRTYSVDQTCLLLTKICLFLSPSCWDQRHGLHAWLFWYFLLSLKLWGVKSFYFRGDEVGTERLPKLSKAVGAWVSLGGFSPCSCPLALGATAPLTYCENTVMKL